MSGVRALEHAGVRLGPRAAPCGPGSCCGDQRFPPGTGEFHRLLLHAAGQASARCRQDSGQTVICGNQAPFFSIFFNIESQWQKKKSMAHTVFSLLGVSVKVR